MHILAEFIKRNASFSGVGLVEINPFRAIQIAVQMKRRINIVDAVISFVLIVVITVLDTAQNGYVKFLSASEKPTLKLICFDLPSGTIPASISNLPFCIGFWEGSI